MQDLDLHGKKPDHQDLSGALLAHITPTLPPGDPVRQINEIIERPDAEGYVQSLDPHALFRLIKAAGWDQGEDLVPMATPRQIQSFLDFDVWRRDRLIPRRMNRWLDVVTRDTGDARFVRVLRDMDAEVIALYFKEHLLVEHIDEEGQIPEHMPLHAERSPDGVFAIAYPQEDEETAVVLRNLVKRLFETDMALAWTLLEAVRWELNSEMEEYAYRWRSSRLEEFGFLPREEAMAIYRLLSPEQTRAKLEAGDEEAHRLYRPQHLDVPTTLQSELTDEFLVLRLLHQLDDPELVQARLFELMAVNNRTLVADGIEPGELESGRQVIRRTLGYMSLGLEYLSRADEERGLELVRTRPFAELFRVGWSSVHRLHTQARRLEQSPTLTLVDSERFSLLTPGEAALFEELVRQRPTFAEDAVTFDIFKEQAQLDHAALVVGRAAFKQLWLFVLLGMTPDLLADLIYGGSLRNEPVEITFDVLFATWLVTYMTTGAPALRGLTREELGALLGLVQEKPWSEEGVAAYLHDLLAPVAAMLPMASPRLITDWAEDTLTRLVDELERVRDMQAPHLVTGLVLLGS